MLLLRGGLNSEVIGGIRREIISAIIKVSQESCPALYDPDLFSNN